MRKKSTTRSLVREGIIILLGFLLTACSGSSSGDSSGGDSGFVEPPLNPVEQVYVTERGRSSFVLRMDGMAIPPADIDSGFAGNGHTETWDGRVFIARTGGCRLNQNDTARGGWLSI